MLILAQGLHTCDSSPSTKPLRITDMSVAPRVNEKSDHRRVPGLPIRDCAGRWPKVAQGEGNRYDSKDILSAQ